MMMIKLSPGGEFAMPGFCAPVRVADAAQLWALRSLVAACGSVLVADVEADEMPAPAPVRPATPIWDTPTHGVRTARCACCAKRRDLVAYTGTDAATANLCFRCGSDRAQGQECTSRPRTYTQTFTDADWA
jgi:hypothetical protein